MNGSTQATNPLQEQENPWRSPNGVPTPRRSSVALAVFLLAAASATVPLSFIQPWVGAGLWGAMLVGCAVLFRRMRVGVTLTLVASVAALLFSGSYLFVGELAVALAVGSFACAYLFTVQERPYLVCCVPLIALGVTMLFTQDWLLILSALSLLPAGALIAWATKRGMTRTAVICCGAAGLLLAALVLLAVGIARTEAGLSLETVTALLDTWKERLLTEQKEMRDGLLAMLEQAYASTGTAGTESAQTALDYYRRLLSDTALSEELTRLFNLLPGVAVAVALVAAYLAQLLLNEGYEASGMRSVITPESEFLVLSLPAAVLYFVCLILSVLFDGSYAVPIVTAENLELILTPGFCAVGWHTLTRAMRSIPAGGRWILILPLLALVCCASSSILYILAAYGAYMTILAAVRRSIQRRNSGNGSSGGPLG